MVSTLDGTIAEVECIEYNSNNTNSFSQEAKSVKVCFQIMSDFDLDDGDDYQLYDLLSNLMGITGLDKEGAKTWLQIGNMDVERAIDLFLSSQVSTTVPSFVGDGMIVN